METPTSGCPFRRFCDCAQEKCSAGKPQPLVSTLDSTCPVEETVRMTWGKAMNTANEYASVTRRRRYVKGFQNPASGRWAYAVRLRP